MSDKIDILNRAIGDRVWKHRVETGVSRSQIAKYLNVSHQQFEKYEKGLNRISAGALSAIMEYLSISPEQFFSDLKIDGNTPAQRRMCRELSNNFMRIKEPKFKRLLTITAKVLAEKD